ncbi:L,D-transpeptidase family protein [Streptomyces sp. YC504]|uniref:L,D-transpeptidase family protein n=1 Tax=Streptomyces mesophilus TaxID=1775132 RepID=A0A6G4XF48_9ACTN|nr:L,D-transpeptidase family protein [Streptomyces mesophilus]NGO75802.1 L,D-transpeptidase family protein [Streptomyces mesophilus]
MIHRTARRTTRLTLAVVLALAALATPAVAADPGPPPVPAPQQELVPGVPLTPYHRWQLDTPDQGMAPFVYEPSAAEDSVEPMEPPVELDALIEYVPPSEVVRSAAAPFCSKRTGPHQRRVEAWLKLKVDGKQSAKDCAAIRAFQRKQGIRPDIGFAGPVTWARMRWLSAVRDPKALKKCPARAYRIACVDLARQLMWVQKGGKVTFGPVAVRSGKRSTPTRTGWHKVFWKHKNHYSTLFRTPMPYSQFFSGGQAFHAVYSSVYSTSGSPGCVNLSHRDAKRLWNKLYKGDRVYIWGRRP